MSKELARSGPSLVSLKEQQDKPHDAGLSKPKKTVVPRLKSSCIGLQDLQQVAKTDFETLLVDIFNKVTGVKELTLVIDESIISPLSLIMPPSFLSEKGVNPAIHTTSEEKVETKLDTVLYLVRPRIEIIKQISKQILQWKDHKDKKLSKNIFICLVPRRNLISEITLQKYGCYDLEGLQKPLLEYSLDLIPFDNDFLSMENPFAFRELAMDGDNSSLVFAARSLMKLQAIYGLIPKMKYLGLNGLRMFKMLKGMKTKVLSEKNFSFRVDYKIGELIIVDRTVDLFSPLVTQLTYEGLIDELFTISNNSLNISFLNKVPTDKKKKIPLNDDDEVYVQIRHENFNSIGKILNKEANFIQEQYKEREKMNSNNVSLKEVKEFIKKLPSLQQRHEDLTIHIAIAQSIKDKISKNVFRKTLESEQNILNNTNEQDVVNFIEEMIVEQEPLEKVLRLICLMSLVQNGLSQKVFDSIRKELVHSYGYDIMMTLFNLEYTGLLKRHKERGSWDGTKKALSLMESGNIDEDKKDNIAYVHSNIGYAPLLVRVIENYHDRWMELQNVFPGVDVGEEAGSVHDSNTESTLVFFVGGITYAEISALRSLAKAKKLSSENLIIATTKVISGNSLMASMFEPLGE